MKESGQNWNIFGAIETFMLCMVHSIFNHWISLSMVEHICDMRTVLKSKANGENVRETLKQI